MSESPSPPLSEAGFDLETVDRLLSTTRAVRRRLDFDRPVPRAVLLDCIRLSQQAPTGTNAQHWRWIVVDDPEKKKALGEIYARGLPLLDESAKQITHLLSHARENGYRTIEPTEEGEQAWVETILSGGGFAPGSIGGPNCTPGYYNNEGQPNPSAAKSAAYGGGSIKFFALLEKWRAAGDFEGIEFGE